jgi:serine/threonine protein kinase
VLKIFDFGLAKELKDCDKTSNGLYKLTGFTGAVRYMAPEVGLYKAYNLSADVYSWSMIMWFILALEPPFGLYTNNMIADRVFVRGSRPAVFKKWKEPIANLMQQSWDADLTKRPSFREISNVLKHELIGCDGTVAGSMTCSSQVGSVAEGPDEE